MFQPSFCTKCSLQTGNLVEIYPQIPADSHHSQQGLVVHAQSRINYLCPRCIIGHSCPIQRPDIGEWHFGRINQHDGRVGRFTATFLDGSTEWVKVENKPMSSYLAYHEEKSMIHCRSRLQTWQLRKNCSNMINTATKDNSKDTSIDREKLDNSETGTDLFWSRPDVERWDEKFIPISHFLDSNTGINAENIGVSEVSKSLESEKLKIYKVIQERANNALYFKASSSRKAQRNQNPYEMSQHRDSKLFLERKISKELNLRAWSTPEDAVLWQLYNLFGSKWSKMAKFPLLKGRTDIAIKNRLHHMQQKFEKDVSKYIGCYTKDDQTREQKERSKRIFNTSHRSSAQSIQVIAMLEHFAIQSLRGSNDSKSELSVFGPMRFVDPSGEICRRCGLFAPSMQTGSTLSTTTDWCYACTRIPAYVSGDMLRECLSIRHKKCAGIES